MRYSKVAMFLIYHIKEKEDRRKRLCINRNIKLRKIKDGLWRKNKLMMA